MKRIEEVVGEPVIGEKYLVPCVMYRNDWTPVLGRCHDDKEIIGFSDRHWHYDYRFVSQEEFDHYAGSYGGEMKIMARLVAEKDVTEGPIPKPLICLRRMPIFPHEFIDWRGEIKEVPYLRDLEKQFEKTKLNCAKCPHRGFDLSQLPQNRNGDVTCPGHGLRWNAKTGELVKRT